MATEICPICYDEFEARDVLALECKHKFHAVCIANWFRASPHCPMCRRTGSLTELEILMDARAVILFDAEQKDCELSERTGRILAALDIMFEAHAQLEADRKKVATLLAKAKDLYERAHACDCKKRRDAV